MVPFKTSMGHFSQHQLNSETECNVCILCGENHMPTLRKPKLKFWDFPESCKHAKKSLNVKSQKEIKLSQPFANYPVPCPVCEELIYRYALETHYAKNHPTDTIPVEHKVSEAEKRLVRNKNFNSKQATNVTEISRLADSE